jgi:exo-beta-1,3-glucanase (GH17 family)
MTFDPDAATAGDLSTCRKDLEDACNHVRAMWAASSEDQVQAMVLGFEALLRASAVLTNIVERVDEQQRTDRRRIGLLNGRMSGVEMVS